MMLSHLLQNVLISNSMLDMMVNEWEQINTQLIDRDVKISVWTRYKGGYVGLYSLQKHDDQAILMLSDSALTKVY